MTCKPGAEGSTGAPGSGRLAITVSEERFDGGNFIDDKGGRGATHVLVRFFGSHDDDNTGLDRLKRESLVSGTAVVPF